MRTNEIKTEIYEIYEKISNIKQKITHTIFNNMKR